MRIIYLSQGYTGHDHRFLAALAQTKHEVHYLRLEPANPKRETRPVPARIRQPVWEGGRGPFRWRNVPNLARDLRRVVQEVKPDLIHAGPIQTSAFVAVQSGFHPILAMSWGFDLQQDSHRNLWWSWVTRHTLQRSDFFTCDAAVTRELAVRYGVSPDRTSVFPWGVDLKRFRPAIARASRGSTSYRSEQRRRVSVRPFVLLCNRSWEPRYRVDILAKAFASAARTSPRLYLTLLGDGSEAQKIRKPLHDGAVLDRVEFGGRVSQAALPHWYHKADLYVSPSHVDGSSVSLMEALACGIPALVSDIPANKEWVQEGVNGWLFRDGDSDALAQKILTIADQPSQLRAVGRRARTVAVLRADWTKNFRVLLRAYEAAVRLGSEVKG